ncbi:Transcriptional regulator, LysR family [Labilithrix luteola]|uniref:Transcriptional regulator, LysR family n=1 Tax=Labilithrix luteola TaxID=1391654 RepID=A0A0K1Q295_9BACT|nr:LysR family transcriptional regulator [Labilithrix luteola]AKU99761.1 Transcriptional regulator, LysR family [Labilithrix luteola]
MARNDVNRSGEMATFVRVVELGDFSAAARALRMTPSAVSKLVARLEERLGVRLFARSTRKLRLTPEGSTFFERSVRILEEMDAAERAVASGTAPRGKLRVNSNIPFGHHCLLPALPKFLAKNPDITVDVVLTDAIVDLLEVPADVAIRTGPLRESFLVARKLGESRMVVVASPAYLASRGTPRTPEDLEGHNRLDFCFARHRDGWPFLTPSGVSKVVSAAGNALVSDGEAMRSLALAGLGIARLASFQVVGDIEAGRLVPLLESFSTRETEPIHAVFVGSASRLPSRVRAFLDFLVENVHLR